MNKEDIRREILNKRNQMSREEVLEKSSAIRKRLEALKEFKKSRLVMCYVSIRNEVITRDLAADMLLKGKRVAVPLVLSGDEERRMLACEIKDMASDLKEGVMGIPEPLPAKDRAVDPRSIDLVIVPGVAFDLERNRLGYGKGYFDRFLSRLAPGCPKIGLAYELQLVDRIPIDEHDVPMDLIVTERRIIGLSAGSCRNPELR